MNTKAILATISTISFLTCAYAEETVKPTPGFPCQGFTKRADGSWWAGDTQPFDFGSSKHMTLKDSGPITRGFAKNGDLDLYDVLEANCGTRAKAGH